MERSFYQTTDINVASALLTLGYHTTVQPSLNLDGKAYFLFDKKTFPDVEDAVNDYWADQIHLSPKQLFSNKRELLTRLKEAARN